uniref:Uncharacterized protein n=1 Tax=Human betaherpesvirus 6A TaxID=32603 RepID=A0A2L2QAI8_9BETA|nr:hypothetical protein [Human betaherpesvirus 6A]AVI07925.1 hypothetical protein [Human betaherpesvirus 6A]AVI08042.1 hypothetical protein [Human betaherpesvirus 6A]AVI08051.1 hypothetical protein [Human betaherpesvirus 6A]AVI08168.1 hypothetical protein [Human betaherpesvirus 6A]
MRGRDPQAGIGPGDGQGDRRAGIMSASAAVRLRRSPAAPSATALLRSLLVSSCDLALLCVLVAPGVGLFPFLVLSALLGLCFVIRVAVRAVIAVSSSAPAALVVVAALLAPVVAVCLFLRFGACGEMDASGCHTPLTRHPCRTGRSARRRRGRRARRRRSPSSLFLVVPRLSGRLAAPARETERKPEA